MYLKKLIVLLIALGFLIPIGSSTVVEKQNEEGLNPSVINHFIFAIGKTDNLTEHKSGYSTPWYTVECVDVYCILSLRDRPIIQHLTNNELMEFGPLSRLYLGGLYTGSFIFMWLRPLFPIYAILFTFL